MSDVSMHDLCIGVYPASGPVFDSPEKVKNFEAGIRYLEALGFEVRVHELVKSVWHHMVAPPQERAAAIMELIRDPDVQVMVPSIGGHSAAASLPYLDFSSVLSSETLIVGFSDNSLISLVASSQTGLPSLHCLADVTFGFSAFARGELPATRDAFLAAVLRGEHDLDLSRATVVQPGHAEGVALGGNLSSIAQLAGTPYWPDWTGKILFWECADELHVMVQDLIQLANCGVFDAISGMVIGKTTQLRESFYERDRVIPLDELLLDVFDLRDRFPIVREAPIGHDLENLAIPIGLPTRLSVEAKPRWCVTDRGGDR